MAEKAGRSQVANLPARGYRKVFGESEEVQSVAQAWQGSGQTFKEIKNQNKREESKFGN